MSNNPKTVKFPNKVTGKLRIGNTAADYGVYGTGTVQKFELGTRYREGDQVWRYGKAGSALNPQRGAFDYTTFFAENTVVAAKVGDMFVVITTDATSGHVTNGFGVEDNMVGGYFSQPDSTSKTFRRITGHAKGASGATIKVYLDGPLTKAMVTNSFSEWCPNPYSSLRQAGGTNRAVMGVPTTVIASDSFGWFQTWGPCWVAQNAAGDFGSANDQMARFHEGGNIEDADTHSNAQIAGFIMGTRSSGNWANPPFVFLQITP
jgi:hypothetical protein